MIQDIYPSKLDNSFRNHKLSANDALFYFDRGGKLLTKIENGTLLLPPAAEGTDAVYLFSVDERRYFLAVDADDHTAGGYAYRTIRELRDLCTGKEIFAAFTAYHLWKWYKDNHFCGACGSVNSLYGTQRALECRRCGHVVYPRINPAVLVGVIDGDRLLITQYRNGYAHNALVAGFTEIGETMEQTVEREVMEETGLRVKNIMYYKSQPWGIAQDLLAGFFCEADGNTDISMDEGELRYAEWVKREDIVLQAGRISLTNEMMEAFKEGRIRASTR